MIKSIVLLSLAVLFCFAFHAGAEDPLGIGNLRIVDTEHSAWWHEIAGTLNDVPDVPAKETTAPTTADVSGRWSLKLNAGTSAQNGAIAIGSKTNSATESVDLGLYQTGDVVFGWGSMIAEGATIVVTASGSMDENTLNLDLISPEKGILYKLDLNVIENSISGSYEAYDIRGAIWFGSVTGAPLE
ncbi:MAG: hypothetical protein ACXQT4_00900 [Methanotrichaceae archaeon]